MKGIEERNGFILYRNKERNNLIFENNINQYNKIYNTIKSILKG